MADEQVVRNVLMGILDPLGDKTNIIGVIIIAQLIGQDSEQWAFCTVAVSQAVRQELRMPR